MADAGRRIWNKTLGKIVIEGGSEDEKEIFYTSLYRTYERMINLSEDGKYYSAFDGKIHEDGGVPFYTDDCSAIRIYERIISSSFCGSIKIRNGCVAR